MVRSSWVVFLFAIACSSKSTTNTIEKDAGSGGGGGSGGVAGSGGDPCVVSNPGWPDSATEYCTDGSAQPAACSALPGQDASYKENTPGYLECSGAIRDTVTGLSWSPVFSGLSQADGMTKCQGLPPGEGPWRLPSLLELVSILDLGSKAPAASNLFGIAAQSQLYSSTAAANGGAWVVSFEFGFVKPSVNAASPST